MAALELVQRGQFACCRPCVCASIDQTSQRHQTSAQRRTLPVCVWVINCQTHLSPFLFLFLFSSIIIIIINDGEGDESLHTHIANYSKQQNTVVVSPSLLLPLLPPPPPPHHFISISVSLVERKKVSFQDLVVGVGLSLSSELLFGSLQLPFPPPPVVVAAAENDRVDE